jgi:hypothetical protein
MLSRYSPFANRSRLIGLLLAGLLAATIGGVTGCPPADGGPNEPNVPGEPNEPGDSDVFNNTTDRTNNGATYIGSDACAACHPDVGARHAVHGHARKLNKIEDGAPSYPAAAARAGGFEPPDGKDWEDVAYVIGGYIRKARFVDVDGYVMTDGVEGVNTQWNLDFPTTGLSAGWVAYEADRDPDDPKPYDYSCFVCHTTGPTEFDPDNPAFQDNRAGMEGTFAEPGIQCESCHGPGSNHIPNPAARDIYVDQRAAACNECHNRPFQSDDGVIRASGGFIRHYAQYPELQASGGHSAFTCNTCHDPHVSVTYDRENALVATCTECHPNRDMAYHEEEVFVRGDYSETLSCESCHMPFATRSAGVAPSTVVGDLGRMGDMRTHIFRINSDPVDFTTMFSADGSEVVKDASGRAAVTLDFVCLRCHNGIGNVFALTVEQAALLAPALHRD